MPAIIQEAVELGVPTGIVISAGFKEHGEAGKELERQIAEIIRGKMRIIGPNCLGVMNPVGGLNATFASAMARPGNVAFISQSGALCTAVLDWSLREMVGFSGFVSVGSMLDVGWGDLIDYFGDDPRTHSIVIYMESVGDARSFLSAAREVSLTKPIIVIKAGRTAAAAKAAASHTGSLTGSDEVLEAAFRRVGVLRVNSISDIVLHVRGAGQAAASARAAPGHRHQCRRSRRAGHRRPDLPGRRTRRTLAGDAWPPTTASCPRRGATTIPSTSWATPNPSATPRRWRSPPRIPASTACW